MKLSEIQNTLTVEETVEFIKKAHEDQTDKGGKPYWMHPVSVMQRIANPTEDEQLAALLHDVVEDTPYSLANLREMGYSANTVKMVDLLTRKPGGGTYIEWIKSLATSGNKGAIKIKIADNEDNSDPDRIARMPPEQQGIVKRYKRSLEILRSVL